jgi:transposase
VCWPGRPRDPVGRIAAQELAELHRLDGQLKARKGELKAAVEELGSHLMNIHSIDPAGAARILADGRAQAASTWSAPPDVRR